MPWSLFANKDSVLVLGDWNDEDSDNVHNDDDDFWPDRSCGSSDSIQSYVESVKDNLPDNESKTIIDTLIPPAVVDMLHERLTGRFRPVVTAM